MSATKAAKLCVKWSTEREDSPESGVLMGEDDWLMESKSIKISIDYQVLFNLNTMEFQNIWNFFS